MHFRMKQVREHYGDANRLEQILILPDFNFAYVPTPKVACSSFKTLCERLYKKNPTFEVPNVHANRSIPTLDKHGWRQVNAWQREGLFGFAFVRDPAKRLASCFTNKMHLARERAPINALLDRDDLRAKITFDDFLTAVEMQAPEQMNPHWRPQHMILMTEKIEYDFIGRLENIKDDFAHIRTTLSLPDAYKLPHRNKAKPRENWVVNLTPAHIRRIEAIYETDYELFGY